MKTFFKPLTEWWKKLPQAKKLAFYWLGVLYVLSASVIQLFVVANVILVIAVTVVSIVAIIE